MSEPNALGDTVHARYRIEGILGRGGAGITYEATDLQAKRRVALKQLVLRGVDDWKLVELFEREARVLAHLTHPSIPRYVEHFTVDDARGASFYVAQEIAEGRSLAAWVASGWRPLETDLRIIAEQVLEILDYLHG